MGLEEGNPLHPYSHRKTEAWKEGGLDLRIESGGGDATVLAKSSAVQKKAWSWGNELVPVTKGEMGWPLRVRKRQSGGRREVGKAREE